MHNGAVVSTLSPHNIKVLVLNLLVTWGLSVWGFHVLPMLAWDSSHSPTVTPHQTTRTLKLVCVAQTHKRSSPLSESQTCMMYENCEISQLCHGLANAHYHHFK